MTRFGCGLAGICRPVLTLRYAAGRKVSSFVHPRSPRQCSRITESIFVYSTSVLLSTSVSKSCYYHIRQLRCIRLHLDSKTASTIATFIVHSKPDMKEWGGDGGWEWWVDRTDGRSATQKTGRVTIGEISAWLTKGSRKLVPKTRGSIRKGTICYS